jgi:flagella basal body P-ring formation protein FlgA
MLIWILATTLALAHSPATGPAACQRPDVPAAVSAAIARLTGGAQGIGIQIQACGVEPGVEIDRAIAEPGARYGRLVRFRLMSQDRQGGYAIALVSGTVRHARVTKSIVAGAELESGDLATVVSDVPGRVIEALPDVRDLVGRRTLRPLAAGDVVTARSVRIPAAVRSGDRVVVRARVGDVEITTLGIAQQSGAVGDVIRLVNQDSRRGLRGRITGRGEVEVVHGS